VLAQTSTFGVCGCEFRHRSLSSRPTSQMGQKATLASSEAMSVLPLKADMKADISAHCPDISFVPNADSRPSALIQSGTIWHSELRSWH
jgi:hypothetical protein